MENTKDRIMNEISFILDEEKEKNKINNACILNQMELDHTSSGEYVRAIRDIKKAMGIEHTIYELYSF